MLIYEIIVLIFAGLGAGIVTGFVGASAVSIAAPLMIIFLGYDAFTAIGISLAIDVFASAVTAYVFRKHNRVKITPSLIILISAVAGAFIGSFFSSYFPTSLLAKTVGFFSILTGLSFMKKDIKENLQSFRNKLKIHRKFVRVTLSILSGLVVGLIAGIFGAGGGITLLVILTVILGFRIHTAIGTSVFIMAFIALSGTVGHLVYGSIPWYPFVIAAIAGVIGAYYAATKTNGISEENLQKLIGFIFFVLGLFLLLKELIIFFA